MGTMPFNINMYVGGSGYWKLEHWLAGKGLPFCDSYSEISKMDTSINGRRTLDIVVSNMVDSGCVYTYVQIPQYRSRKLLSAVTPSSVVIMADPAVLFNSQHGGPILQNVWSR